MSKILGKINLVVNFLMLLAFLITSFSAIIAKEILPRGNGHVNIFLGIKRGEWLEIHDKIGYFLIILILIHLGLHWRWFLNQLIKIKTWF